MSEELKPDCWYYNERVELAAALARAESLEKELEDHAFKTAQHIGGLELMLEKAEKERDEWKEKHSDYVKRQACNARAFGSLEAERDALQKRVAELEAAIRSRPETYWNVENEDCPNCECDHLGVWDGQEFCFFCGAPLAGQQVAHRNDCVWDSVHRTQT